MDIYKQFLRFFLWFAKKTHLDSLISDRVYLELLYRRVMGKPLNLNNPKTFSEKIQWLKLYNRCSDYTVMVDKLAVKEYVADKIGGDYIIPTLGVWDRVEDIEWDTLPEKFVLKTTHDSGSIIICVDKSKLDKVAAANKLKDSLTFDYYKKSREWPYKDVPRRIFAEKYIDPFPKAGGLPDFKWFCFNGEPKYCQVIQGRTTSETIDFFDTNWNHQKFVGLGLNTFAPNSTTTPPKPACLDTQIRIAQVLSKDIPFSRIDLYEIGDRVYFGEITFYPYSGLGSFRPEHINRLFGDLIKLPSGKK